MSVRFRTHCRACDAPLRSFLDLGTQPLANRLPRPDETESVPCFPLTLCRCEGCGLVQLREVVAPELMFADYLYVPSTSSTMRTHFDALAGAAVGRLGLRADDLVADIGSNDGLLLSCFKRRGMRVLGIEPAEHIAATATAAGIPTEAAFFDADLARRLARAGRARLVTATNVFAHVDDVRGFLRAAFELLAEDGVLLIEVQSFADTVATLAFDMTYHEHVTYFATEPLARLCEREGLALLDVERVATHGGSLRALVGRRGHPLEQRASVLSRIEAERADAGVDGCVRLAKGAERAREELPRQLAHVRAGGGRVAGYAAPAKATVLLNYCGVRDKDIEYIVDKNPAKQGRVVPGTGIAVVEPSRLETDPPSHLLILAWNLAEEIKREQERFRAKGGRFMLPSIGLVTDR
jgi:SAM-dependent methyltransferase